MKNKRDSIHSENWKLLANGIILQACKDYQMEPSQRGDAIKFIRSEWFTFLCRGCIKPEDLINHLRSEVYEYGEKNLLKKAQF